MASSLPLAVVVLLLLVASAVPPTAGGKHSGGARMVIIRRGPGTTAGRAGGGRLLEDEVAPEIGGLLGAGGGGGGIGYGALDKDRTGCQSGNQGLFGCWLPGSSDARQHPQAFDFDRLGLRLIAWQASPGQGAIQTNPQCAAQAGGSYTRGCTYNDRCPH
ncbi:uncharacterized protein LOC120667984 [Panicum virgatum]|uniref:uncharacterized protein LOC120667984 n=1 Tax=Panicum virgatum TaxID=38727 RepID=UPI0019D55868|nr:uncharacterized protein LOC120667984 [Panicum virgatum]